MKEMKMIIKEWDIEKQLRVLSDKVESYTVKNLNNRLNPETKILTIVLRS